MSIKAKQVFARETIQRTSPPRDLTPLKPSPLSTDEIIARAIETADEYGYEFNGKLGQVLKQIGATIEFNSLHKNQGQDNISAIIPPSAKLYGVVQQGEPRGTNTFDIATFIGHRELHFVAKGKMIDDKSMIIPRHPKDDTDTKLALRQARIFALNFLAPAAQIEQKLNNDLLLQEIAGQLGVFELDIKQQIKYHGIPLSQPAAEQALQK